MGMLLTTNMVLRERMVRAAALLQVLTFWLGSIWTVMDGCLAGCAAHWWIHASGHICR